MDAGHSMYIIRSTGDVVWTPWILSNKLDLLAHKGEPQADRTANKRVLEPLTDDLWASFPGSIVSRGLA